MQLHILVAEDDPHTRHALVELLTSDGHRVTEAADGQQAKHLFDKHPPDLACLDVMMPGISGFDLCRHFRSRCDRMPILLITAKAEEIDKVVGLELGADDYIVKPFGTKEVLARIHAVARRCFVTNTQDQDDVQLSQSDFEMADLTVMPRKFRATRGDQLFELTSREVRILQLLAARSGEVVSREELFRIAWQDAALPSSRTIDQTISQLRKRIERDPRHPKIIQTVYGGGYRFE